MSDKIALRQMLALKRNGVSAESLGCRRTMSVNCWDVYPIRLFRRQKELRPVYVNLKRNKK